MNTDSPADQFTFGMIGLGTMGRNLLLNMADHGFAVAGYDQNPAQSVLLEKEGVGNKVKGFTQIEPFVASLKSPRVIMMLVPAGRIVDSVIAELVPLLDKGDIIIDGGNSHFTDTTRRDAELEAMGLHFFGMGISGGEEGARRGPSMMPGGDKTAYQYVKPVLDAVAARVNGDPCVTYIGPGAAGHFVKMVHNGIEYAVMQLIAETYEVLRKGLKMDNEAIGAVFADWNAGRLQSFLLEVTRDIFAFREPGTDHLLLDMIKDEARSKGTGKWTSQIAMDMVTPIPAIDSSVAMRDLSKYKSLRVEAASIYGDDIQPLAVDRDAFLKSLEQAFFFSMITTYAQGMHLLSSASVQNTYDLNLGEITKIWRGGCIIRAAFLETMLQAYTANPSLEHLLVAPNVTDLIRETQPGIRTVVSSAISAGIALPTYAATLSYFDAFRSARMPSNLIQAQRDYFGAHTYERIDKEGVFHTEWQGEASVKPLG
ncbi:NADP-dependent phosphogluconate dehydrogenase [Spirosoma fluviale]|uniref:6-phosphogluconate dehydrogenase, decarboxylating n=1 Tax=Spirosoma fluviale TaxID=1597977 RepID=A0A286FCL5_9BACT|nr:NADP-dependent phosphogluconate dehydrogenase [Spirosoma fluviale]SOD80719.1 6-phosphogluconate dehydrogenase [Spirosoma fluviale]